MSLAACVVLGETGGVFRFGRGNFSQYLPTEVTRVPVALLGRPYPGDPRGFAAAVQQYAAGDIPVAMYPRRMLLDKYKTPPVKPVFSGNATGAAMAGWQPSYPWSPNQMIGGNAPAPTPFIPARVPAVSASQFTHSRGMARLPQPSDNMSVNLRQGYYPLTRGAWPANQTVSAPKLVRFIDTTAAPIGTRDQTPEALAAVARVRKEYRQLMEEQAQMPWFLVAPS